MISKEKDLLELFFNFPNKHWKFKELRKEVKISETKLVKWLSRFQKQNIIQKIKPKGKMPYYTSNSKSPEFQNRKKLFAMNKFYDCGLLNYLRSLKKAKTIIIFGSFARADWYKESDIDLFVYGYKTLNLRSYESRLKRDIQLFSCKNTKELKRFGSRLIRNILRGDVVKGYIPNEIFENANIKN